MYYQKKNLDYIIHPELSFKITGICFHIHNTLGRYAREKQYADEFEYLIHKTGIPYIREYQITNTGNIIDFLVDSKIILEFKACPALTRDNYYQVQRYLQACNKKLGLLINFRNRYLKPVRIVKIETSTMNRFL